MVDKARIEALFAKAEAGNPDPVGPGVTAFERAMRRAESARAVRAEERAGLGDLTVGEAGRTLARGAQMGLEFLGDTADVLATGAGAVPPSPMTGEGGMTPEDIPNPLTEETAGDELRAPLHEALDPYTRRTVPPGSPLLEGALTALETAGGGLVGGTPRTVVKQGGTLLTSALGAGAGRAAAEGMDLGPTGTLVAEFLGGGIGALTPGTFKTVVNRVRDLAEQIRDGTDNVGIRRQALADIQATIEVGLDPDEVSEVMARFRDRIENADAGTLAHLADTPGARGMEDAVRRRTGATRDIEAAQREVQDQTVDRLRTVVPDGDADEAIVLAQARAEAARRGASRGADLQTRQAERAGRARIANEEQGLVRAQEAAQRARAGRAVPDVETAGLSVSERVDDAREAVRRAEKDAWAEVPKTEMIDTAPIVVDIRQAMPEPDTVAWRDFARRNPSVVAEIEAIKPQMTGGDLIDLQHVVSDAIADANRPGGGGAGSFADAVNSRVTKAIRQALDDHPSLGPEYEAARALTRDRIDRFDSGPLAKAVRAARDAPATVGEKLVPPGTKGGAAVRAAKRAGPEAVAALEDSVRAQFRKAVYTPAGEYRPLAADRFLSSREAAFNEMPELRDELEQLAVVESEAVQTAKRLPKATREIETDVTQQTSRLSRARAAAEQRIEQSPIARFRGDTGGDAARDVLQGKDAAASSASLMQNARAAGDDAVADLRSAFVDGMLGELVSVAGRGRRVAGEATAMIRRREKALREVLTDDQYDQLLETAEPLDRLARGQSVEHVDMRDITDDPVTRTLSGAMRLAAAKTLGAVTGTPLLASNMGSAVVRRYLRKVPQEKYQRFMREYMINPRRYADDMDRLMDTAVPPADVISMLDRFFAAGPLVTAAGSRVQDEED